MYLRDDGLFFNRLRFIIKNKQIERENSYCEEDSSSSPNRKLFEAHKEQVTITSTLREKNMILERRYVSDTHEGLFSYQTIK